MMHVPDTNAVAANSCCSADMQPRVDDQRILPSEKVISPATLLPPSQDESGLSNICHGEERCQTPPERPYTHEQQYALTCLSEMLAVVGVDEELARGVDQVQQSAKNRKVVTPPQPRSLYPTKVTPPVVSKQPKQDLGPTASSPASSKSNQRRTLFNLSKYQSPQSNYCNAAERTSSPSMSIVPTIDNARPSSRKLALRNLHHSSPDLRSPQPAKSLLKKEKDTSADSSSPSSSMKRSNSSVSFSNLEIREYNIALSDHPDCSYGPPIQLGWEYCEQETVSVDDYEQQRTPRRRSRFLLHDAFDRSLWLNQAGYTEQELQSAMEDVHRVKQERLREKRRHTSRQQTNGLGVAHLFESLLGNNRRMSY